MKRFAAVVTCWAITSAVYGATNSWEDSDGNWQNLNKWSLIQRPASDQDIVITNTGTFTLTINDQTASSFPGTMTVLSLLTSNATGLTTLLITNRPTNTASLTFTVLTDMQIGLGSLLRLTDQSATSAGITVQSSNVVNTGSIQLEPNTTLLALSSLTLGSATSTGRVERLGGKLLIGVIPGDASSDYDISIGVSANSTGLVTVANGEFLPPGGSTLGVGERGVGSLVVSDGYMHVGPVAVGAANGANGLWRIKGGTCLVGNVTVGNGVGTTGQLWQTGGSLLIPGNSLSLGQSGGVGHYVISNGLLNAAYLIVPQYGGSGSSVQIAGGKLDINGGPGSGLLIGYGGTGIVWQTGGELVVTGSTYAGQITFRDNFLGTATVSTLVCSGGVLRASDVVFESRGISLWNIVGGTSIVERAIYLARDPATAICHVSGGRLEARTVYVGSFPGLPAAGGHLKVSGGEAQVSQLLSLGVSPLGQSVVEVNGGQFIVSDLQVPSSTFPAFIGDSGTGELHISGGSFLTGTAYVGFQTGSVGTMTVSGGVADVGSTIINRIQDDPLILGYGVASTGTVVVTGGNLRTYSVTAGKAGVGSLLVGPQGNLAPTALTVGKLAGSIGVASFQGGTLTGPATRRLLFVHIAPASGSVGSVFVTDGALAIGRTGICYPGEGVFVGEQGTGLFGATNALLQFNNAYVGSDGRMDLVNCQVTMGYGSGCVVVNSNAIHLVNTTAIVEAPVQNVGTIYVDGGPVTFNQLVTNTGRIIATNGVVEFLGGITNTGSVALGPEQFYIASVTTTGDNIVISWQAFGGNQYRVQAANSPSGPYAGISPKILAAGSGLLLTNYVDAAALTNIAPRFYRIRQVF